MAYQCSECKAFHAVFSPPDEAKCCADWWVIATNPPTPPVDVDVKVEPGDHFMANYGPFQCTMCDALHAGPDPPESARCCPYFFVVAMGEVSAAAIGAMGEVSAAAIGED